MFLGVFGVRGAFADFGAFGAVEFLKGCMGFWRRVRRRGVELLGIIEDSGGNSVGSDEGSK